MALVNRRKNFRLQAQYRSQEHGQSDKNNRVPGICSVCDSTWRSAATDFYNLPIENLDWI